MLSLDGKKGFMRVPVSASFHLLTDEMTLETWFRAWSFYTPEFAVNSLLRKNVEPGRQNFFLRFRIMKGKPAVEVGWGDQIMQAPYDFEIGTWYHLAATYDGKVMSVFVNGVRVHSGRSPGSILIDDSDLIIGKGDPNFSLGEYFHGDLNEIRIWNVARSPEQIQAAMITQLTRNEPGLVAYWTFDDGSPKDVSGHDNNGILEGQARIGKTH
jgi:Concanavalin A-like lectin/glucanases superfamily